MRTSVLHPLVPAIALFLCAAGTLHAQTDYRGISTNMLTVGAGFYPGGSLTLDPPRAHLVKPVFAYRITADATYPLNPTVSALMSLGVDSRGTRIHPLDDEDSYTDYTITYLALTPAFKFSAFTLGMNFGFPLSGTVDAPTFGGNHAEGDIDSDVMTVMLEPRLGVLVPLIDEEIGWLGFALDIGYTINNLLDVGTEDAGLEGVLAAHLGLTWQFGIPGTARR